MQRLANRGLANDTIVILWGDHGWHLGEHAVWGKHTLFEESLRSPLIVSHPQMNKPGQPTDAVVETLDVFPTLCDLAGIGLPETIEGLSFRSILEGRQSTVRDVLYGAYSGGRKPGMRCVRQGDWKLIKYDVMDGTVRHTQLFNLAENPHEFLVEHGRQNPRETNLADDPEFAEKRREMEALLLAEMQRLDDPYRFWDQPQK